LPPLPAVNRLSLLALLLLLPSCSAFKLSEGGTATSRGAIGRASVAEGRRYYAAPQGKPQPVVAPAQSDPATTPPHSAAVAASPSVAPSQLAAAPPQPVKPAERQPQPVKTNPTDDAEKLRLPGDLLNQLPADKDYKPSTSSANDDAPVIAKPPGAR
jgi:hypothetical protein